MSNLLVIDFDTFFPNPMGDPEGGKRPDWGLYDWGHKEAPFFINHVWDSRAEGFVINNLPLPDLDGRELGFWDRFRIRDKALLYYADSNACAANPLLTGKRRSWDSVWLYDAHHDSGYNREPWVKLVSQGVFSCENWMVLYYALGASLHVRYPAWRAWAMAGEPEPVVKVDRAVDDDSTPEPVFDRVFVCRSGAWVPPWNNIDQRFEAFLQASPVSEKRHVNLQPDYMRRREYNHASVLEQVEWRRKHFPEHQP